MADREDGDRGRSDGEVLKAAVYGWLFIFAAGGFVHLLFKLISKLKERWDSGAASTLIAGGVAVAGAIWVGLKQTEIQSRQVKLQETDVKIQLLDRRISAICLLKDFDNLMRRGTSNIDLNSIETAMVEASLTFDEKTLKSSEVIFSELRNIIFEKIKNDGIAHASLYYVINKTCDRVANFINELENSSRINL